MTYKFKVLDEHKLQLINEGIIWTKFYEIFLTYNDNCKPFLRVKGKYCSQSSEYTHITDEEKVREALKYQRINKKKLKAAQFPDSIDKRVQAGWVSILEWLKLI